MNCYLFSYIIVFSEIYSLITLTSANNLHGQMIGFTLQLFADYSSPNIKMLKLVDVCMDV